MVKSGFEVIKRMGDVSKDGVLIFDLSDNSFQYINPALERILEHSVQAVLAEPSLILDYIIVDDIDYIKNRFQGLTQKHYARNVEFWIKTKKGNKYLSCDAYVIAEENVAVAMVKDISLSKQHMDYIANYGGKKDTVLEMLSHNLSGPLSLSQRVIKLMEKEQRKVKSADVTPHITFIKEVTQQCIDIINDFLKDEHLTSERIFVKRSRFDVIEKTKLIIEQYNHSYPGRQLQLKTESEHLYVNSDDVKFMQIVNNLISNAIKFTPPNCTVEVNIKEQDDKLVFAVADDGIGIPEHMKPLIFEKYTPAGRVGLNGEKSVGVGLSIVKNLVHLMDGAIHFDSEENRGSTFVVTFPK